jgi:hypothetical protein
VFPIVFPTLRGDDARHGAVAKRQRRRLPFAQLSRNRLTIHKCYRLSLQPVRRAGRLGGRLPSVTLPNNIVPAGRSAQFRLPNDPYAVTASLS